MYTCTLFKLQVSWSLHVAQFPLRTQRQSCITSEPPNKTLVANSTAFAYVLRGLVILDLCSRGTWTATSLARHCKGHSLRDLVGTPAFTGISGCRIDTKTKKVMFTAVLDIRNVISPCLRLCCTNNRIIISFLCV